MPTATPARFTPTGFQPTHEQIDIQLSQHRVTLIQANAGAAKTTTLALRIGEALARGLPAARILALVFTPAAKDVMKARLRELGIPAATAAQVQVQTLEEFAGQVLKGIEDRSPPQITSAKELREHAVEAITHVSEAYPEKADFLDIRVHDIAISQFLQYQLQLKATMAIDEENDDRELEHVAEDLGVPLTDYLSTLAYEDIRLGTFEDVRFRGPGDATYDLAAMLRDYPETKTAFPLYRLVVADELHDVNEASFRILEALLGMDKLYFVGAGDKDQVIYSHQGADEKYLNHRFAASFPHTAHYPLTMTYRHGPHLAYAMEAFKGKPIDSTLPVNTRIAELFYDHAAADACADQVVEAIRKWKSDKYRLEACAILLRDRHQSIAIENALMAADIGYRAENMPSSLRCEEVLFLRGMIAIALNNLTAVKSQSILKGIVESLVTFGEVPLNAREIDEAKNTIARDPATLHMFFTGQIQHAGGQDAKTRIAAAVSYMQSLAPDTPAHAAIGEVCELIDIRALAKRIYVHPYDASVIVKSIEGFIAMARKSELNLRQFSEWMGAADGYMESRRSKDLVLIECVANAKGKEFEHVILPYLERGEFPNGLKALKEEENLFYVGATRAKFRLTLIAPGEEAMRSPFIQQMKLPATLARANNALRKNQSQHQTALTRHDLTATYAEKDMVKALGAQWDSAREVWYVRAGMDLEPFRRWLRTP